LVLSLSRLLEPQVSENNQYRKPLKAWSEFMREDAPFRTRETGLKWVKAGFLKVIEVNGRDFVDMVDWRRRTGE
jgi:hypothetical protein